MPLPLPTSLRTRPIFFSIIRTFVIIALATSETYQSNSCIVLRASVLEHDPMSLHIRKVFLCLFARAGTQTYCVALLNNIFNQSGGLIDMRVLL